MLAYIYITNDPVVAQIAETAGVSEIFVDLEKIGKEDRQRGMNTVKSDHSIADVIAVRSALKKARLLVRVNSIHENSEEEIRAVINAGADILMLPYFKTVEEVETFLTFCGGSVQTRLLVETAEAAEKLEEILSLPGVDSAYIGLNDLHLSLHKKFMFELLTDGTADRICKILQAHNLPFGIGGVASLGKGTLPAEYILAEHYRLGSSMVILSRSFCNLAEHTDPAEIREIFTNGVHDLHAYEQKLAAESEQFFIQSHQTTAQIIKQITEEIV